MGYEIEIVNASPQPALTIEATCAPDELGNVLGASFGRIHAHITAAGQQQEGMPFLRYLSMSDDAFRIHAGIPTSVAGDGDIVAIELPGGELATTLYLGPYAGVGEAWDAMHAWAAERGVSADGGWDVYENDPTTVADESEYRTRLYLPAS